MPHKIYSAESMLEDMLNSIEETYKKIYNDATENATIDPYMALARFQTDIRRCINNPEISAIVERLKYHENILDHPELEELESEDVVVPVVAPIHHYKKLIKVNTASHLLNQSPASGRYWIYYVSRMDRVEPYHVTTIHKGAKGFHLSSQNGVGIWAPEDALILIFEED